MRKKRIFGIIFILLSVGIVLSQYFLGINWVTGKNTGVSWLGQAEVVISAVLFIVGLFLTLTGKSNSDEEFPPERNKIKTAVMAIFLLTSASLVGWEYYTHGRNIHEGVFWSAMGFGYSFEEDDFIIVAPKPTEGNCDDLGGRDWENEDGLCISPLIDEGTELSWSHINLNDGNLGEELCTSEDDDCLYLYFRAGGIILFNEENGMCFILVKDIIAPPSVIDLSSPNEEQDEWLKEFWEKGTGIYDEAPDELCDEYYPPMSEPYVSQYEEEDDYDWTNDYEWSHADAAGSMSDDTGDALVEITMTQGTDLNWAMLKVTIKVDGGTPVACGESDDAEADCTWAPFGGPGNYQAWEAGEGITISEGDVDLCSGSDGGCKIRVTITKKGTGSDADVVIGIMNAYANGYN